MRWANPRAFRARTMGVLALLCAGVIGGDAAWGVTSTWQPFGAGATNWFTTTKWNNGVPNAPGDVAILRGNIPTLTVPSAIMLGELQLEAPATQTITGLGSFVFENANDGPALIHVIAPRGGNVTTSIDVPIAIADPNGLRLDVRSGSRISLSQPVELETSRMVKTGEGTLTLGRGNQISGGTLEVEGGVLEVAAIGVLEGTAETSVESGGVIRFFNGTDLPPGDEIHVVSLLSLSNATLTTSIPTIRARDTFIVGHIELADMNQFSTGELDRLTITGAIDGAGGIEFRAVPVSNAIGNALIRLTGPTSYMGPTIVRQGARAQLDVGSSIGSCDSGTLVQGELFLNGQGGGAERILR